MMPDANWWFHHGLGRGFSYNQLSVSNVDVKKLAASYANGNEKSAGAEHQLIEEYYTTFSKNNATFSLDLPLEHFCSPCKGNSPLFERPKKLYSESDSRWIGLKKIEPWWHAVSKDDLTPLVSQASSRHIRNQDPGVQSLHVDKETNVMDCRAILPSMEDKLISYVDDSTQGNPASVRMDRLLGKRGSTECKLLESDGSSSSGNSFKTPKGESSDTKEPSGDLSRTKLLEALCHSQTKAREAEKLAQEACDEKDDVINLFFRQASCLFAYRQ